MPTAPKTFEQRRREHRAQAKPKRIAISVDMAWRQKTASEKGYDQAWQDASKAYLASNPTCEACGQNASTEAHHIVPRRHGGSNDWSNLKALCKSCHSRATRRERYRRGCRKVR